MEEAAGPAGSACMTTCSSAHRLGTITPLSPSFFVRKISLQHFLRWACENTLNYQVLPKMPGQNEGGKKNLDSKAVYYLVQTK